jgi:hypothetical protein
MMSESASKYSAALSTVLRATEALKNWKALVLLGCTFLVGAVVIMLGGYIASLLIPRSPNMASVVGLVFGLFSFIFLSAGASGVGIMLMDQAQGIEVRGMVDAFIAGLSCVLKIILVTLIDGVFWLILVLVSALLIFICKIPGVGAALYAVVYPLLVLMWGIVAVATTLAVIPMTLPAIWEGNSIKGVYIRLLALAQGRFMDIILALIVLSLITGLIASFIGFAYSSGTFMTSMLSAPIILPSGEGGGLAGLYQGVMGMAAGQSGGAGSGYVVATVFGGGVLLMVMMAFPILVYIFGINLVYLGAMEGLDLASAENSINEKIAETRRRAEEARARAEAVSKRAREMAEKRRTNQQAITKTSTPQDDTVDQLLCPACHAVITEDDLFCGECGHKLK